MKYNGLYPPGFHLPTLRLVPRSARQRLADEGENSLSFNQSIERECCLIYSAQALPFSQTSTTAYGQAHSILEQGNLENILAHSADMLCRGLPALKHGHA